LQQQDGALRGAPPDELATFSLAILDVNIAARVLQAAILELAVHIDAVVQDHVLILERLALMSIHSFSLTAAGRKNRVSPSPEKTSGEPDAGFARPELLVEAIIHVTRMQVCRMGWSGIAGCRSSMVG
jgi:hypothetical protein